ncbi:ankyrin repeat-containing domain protein [Phlyctochytrium arcticum]|nr:ankyrin repeat-containing domain protein [Phlyctochytrium arcticum]
MPADFSHLPYSVLLRVIQFLEPSSMRLLSAFAAVSRGWHSAARSLSASRSALSNKFVERQDWAGLIDYLRDMLEKPLLTSSDSSQTPFGSPKYALSLLDRSLELHHNEISDYLNKPWANYYFITHTLPSEQDYQSHIAFRERLFKAGNRLTQATLLSAANAYTVDWLTVETILRHESELPTIPDGDFGADLLASAARDGEERVLSTLLDKFKVNARASNELALNRACASAHFSVVKTLVESGSDPNKADGGKGYALPLSSAAFLGKKEMVDYLLSNGADINGERGQALFMAFFGIVAGCGSLEIIKHLVSKGATFGSEPERIIGAAIYTGSAAALQALFGHPVLAKHLTKDIVNTALIMACGIKNVDAVKYLLANHKHQVDVNYSRNFEYPGLTGPATPLSAALAMMGTLPPDGGSLTFETADLILQAGADPNANGGIVWEDIILRPLVNSYHESPVRRLVNSYDYDRARLLNGDKPAGGSDGGDDSDVDDDEDDMGSDDEEEEMDEEEVEDDGDESGEDNDDADVEEENAASEEEEEDDTGVAEEPVGEDTPKINIDPSDSYYIERRLILAHLASRGFRPSPSILDRVKQVSPGLHQNYVQALSSDVE